MKCSLLALERVLIGSLEHILPIGIALCFGILFILVARYKMNSLQQKRALHIFGCLVSLTIIAYNLYIYSLGNYDISKDLPLFLCSFMALVVPFFTYSRNYLIYEILFFWVVAGTTQGIITPDIAEGFPVFDYFRYWVVHLGLLIIMFYATFVFRMRPTIKSVFRSIVALQIYTLVMYTINYFLGANYTYLNAKPEAASLLDYLGDWPYYIIVAQFIIIPYFLLIYLPFYITNKNGINEDLLGE